MCDDVLPDRTPPKSPSEPSVDPSSSPSSSQESSPNLRHFSAATSSSDIVLTCGTPDSEQQDHSSTVMEHHNHPFGSPESLRIKNNRSVELIPPASSHPNPGFYNNSSFPPTLFASNNRNIVFRGNNTTAGPFSDRSLTSANWRNANIATSQNSRAYLSQPSYNSNESSSYSQLPPSYRLNSSPPEVSARNMSCPASNQGETTSPTQPGTGQVANPGNDANTGRGTQNDSGSLELVQISKVMSQITKRQQQVAARSGQTDMPYYAYCYDRGNGQYTRLVPADMLPPLVGIPALQQGCLGMTVLPCPTGLAPNGRSSNLERVFVQPPQQFHSGHTRPGNRDPVQSRIDTIIAAIPPAPEAQKRQKIYCDKWIHEGVCAFTQQGCKYKHEMPLDKDTQESLGLFQGLPIWWRKHQGEITSDQHQAQIMDSPCPGTVARPRGFSSTGGSRPGGGGGGGFGGANRLRQNTWRSQGTPPAITTGRRQSHSLSSGSGVASGGGGGQGQQGPVAQFSSPFGPIAPPSSSTTRREYEHAPGIVQATRNPFVDNNPWNVLKNDQGSDDSEEGAKRG